ncbi:hypothetical protein T265_05988 [Opisthorchis viverrini]|uniref:Uncharacterized protein n=1 Tax=Opisthorchis viverrini TaxID=6198 RepID=A0A074ZM65_OPIVI|nr:hypothetical protein T265_05988 [Opisthorchis viverrini]KER26857.1 hypothetical protein T265_05988 [Opisthorchis viverrini]
MNHTSDMNSVSNIERILRTLSKEARRNWARLVDSMDNLGKQMGFSDLCNFIAYGRTREIRKDLFGREYMVARAILNNLFKKLKPVHDHADSLSRLSINL